MVRKCCNPRFVFAGCLNTATPYFADAVAIWEAIGSIPATETITAAATRLCKFDADDASIPPGMQAIDEAVLPADVQWAPWVPPAAASISQ